MRPIEEPERSLTPKGLATRTRIVEAAADLMYLDGVHATNNERVRRAAGVSGSQLSHYFPDKEGLVRAVIAWRAARVTDATLIPGLEGFDSLDGIRLWADAYIAREDVRRGGCSYGSLAAEMLKSDLDLNDDIRSGFARWETLFREGLTAMRDRGDLIAAADPEALAYSLLAAFQGGMLLTQAARDVAPLRAALYGAISLIEHNMAGSTKTTDGSNTGRVHHGR